MCLMHAVPSEVLWRTRGSKSTTTASIPCVETGGEHMATSFLRSEFTAKRSQFVCVSACNSVQAIWKISGLVLKCEIRSAASDGIETLQRADLAEFALQCQNRFPRLHCTALSHRIYLVLWIQLDCGKQRKTFPSSHLWSLSTAVSTDFSVRLYCISCAYTDPQIDPVP